MSYFDEKALKEQTALLNKKHAPRVVDFDASMAKLKARVKGINSKPPAVIEAPVMVAAMQLPLWEDAVRCVPNPVLRSALFGAIKRGSRGYMERQVIHAQEGIKIFYTGARLDQGDLDAWETVLHIARVQSLGDECRFTAYQFLQLLGKTDSGKNRSTLNRRLSRLKATALDVKVSTFSYEGSLINEVYKADDTGEYVIKLNPKLSALFAADQFTKIDWSVRRALDGKPLAQWLHGYYASHAKPFPLNVETLLKMSGSENEDPNSSKQKLRKALDALAEASKVNHQSFTFDIIGTLVSVQKTVSESQRRHLKLKKHRV